MKILTGLSAILLLLIILLWIPHVVKQYGLVHSNKVVIVTIAKLPDCAFGYRNKFVSIRYNDTTHVLRTKCKYVRDYSIGELVPMLHEPGTGLFLFKSEDLGSEVISIVIIGIMVLACLIFSLTKK
jgi:hypothetical protein